MDNIDTLKRQLSCVSVISQFIQIQDGRHPTGLCPFHDDEQTWSLTVYPETNSWYCFGCGRGGDIFNFLTEKGMTFRQAFEWCKLRVGKLPEPKFEPRFRKSEKSPPPDHKIINYWHNLLKDRREYFKSRLLSDETIDRFKLGWTGQRFSIPFWEGEPGNSKVLAVQSRRWNDNGPKYRWELGSQPHIFNLRDISHNGKTTIFFSTLDALLAHQDGIRAVAVPGQTVGTSSENCWRELSAKAGDLIGFREFVVVPDRGEEGKGYQLAHLLNCSLFEWPEGGYSDYCEFRLSNSVEIFKKFMGG